MKSSKQSRLENWLSVLITSYQHQPDQGVIKHILYYIERITHESNYDNALSLCEYQHMKRFWQWKLQQAGN